LPVLVVLDEVMIRIARKSQWVQAQSIDGGFFQQPQIGLDGAQLRQIESDQVMAKEKSGAIGKLIERIKRAGQRARRKGQGVAAIAANPR